MNPEDGHQLKHSLTDLTKAFIQILTSTEGHEVDLGDVQRKLGVSKRRLYDVANVLSGIGMIDRCGKARVKWNGHKKKDEEAVPLIELEEKIDEMDELVTRRINDVVESGLFKECAWFTKEDFSGLTNDPNVSFYVVYGPSCTEAKVQKEDNGDTSIIFDSPDGTVDLTLINLGDEDDGDTQL